MKITAPARLEELVYLLEKRKLHGWEIVFSRTEEIQEFVTGIDRSFEREVEYERAKLRLFVKKGKRMGRAELSLNLDSRSNLREMLERGLESAAANQSPLYNLHSPEKGKFPVPAIASEDVLRNPRRVALKLVEIYRNRLEFLEREKLFLKGRYLSRKKPVISSSSAEFYLNRSKHFFVNSEGVFEQCIRTGSFSEMIILATPSETKNGPGGTESRGELERVKPEPDELVALTDRCAVKAAHSIGAPLPGSGVRPVVLEARHIAKLLSPVLFHLSAEAAYKKVSRLKAGKSITERKVSGDALELSLDPCLDWGLCSYHFDSEGKKPVRIVLVKDGIFNKPWATLAYASYMKVEHTGEPGNLVLDSGTSDLNEIFAKTGKNIQAGSLTSPAGSGPVSMAPLHIVEFSSFEPDNLTGEFVSEIRLAYDYSFEPPLPVKGGTVSGNVFKALEEVIFSKERRFEGDYLGPAFARFERLTVAGA